VGNNKSFTVNELPSGLNLETETGILSGTAPDEGVYDIVVIVSGSEGKDTSGFQIRCGDTLALTPPLGWNSWNKYGGQVDAQLIKQMTDALVSSGLRDLGYQYVNIDDTWSNRDRDSNGDIVPKSDKFPDGIKAVADYCHARGIKLGIYTDVGPSTFCGCAGSGGNPNHYVQDANKFAEWGIDYVKVDNLGGSGSSQSVVKGMYKEFGTAIMNSGRSMIFSICEWGRLKPWDWGRESHGHLWRTTWDLRDKWETSTYTNANNSIMNALDFNQHEIEQNVGVEDIHTYSGPGGWNDMDMMVIANGAMGDKEYQTHMSLWCIFNSPVIFSHNLTNMSQGTKDIILNPEIIAVNQDILGKQAVKVSDNGNQEIFTRNMSDSSKVVGLLNRGSNSTSMSVSWDLLEITGKQTVRDLWQRTDLGIFEDAFSCDVASRECVMLKIKPEPQTSINSSAKKHVSDLQLKQVIYSESSVKLLFSAPAGIIDKNTMITSQIYSVNGKHLKILTPTLKSNTMVIFSWGNTNIATGIFIINLHVGNKMTTHTFAVVL
jgi:alpha-galactosidase